jgi:hypothetical protein
LPGLIRFIALAAWPSSPICRRTTRAARSIIRLLAAIIPLKPSIAWTRLVINA